MNIKMFVITFIVCSFTMMAHTQQPNIDSIELKEGVLDKIESFESKVRLKDFKGFLEGLIDELERYEEASSIVNKYQHFLPNLVRRYLYFSGDYMNEVMGKYIASSFMYNIKRREASGIPILNLHQAKEKIECINRLEQRVCSFIQQIDKKDVAGLDKERKKLLNWDTQKKEILDKILITTGVYRRALTDPTYTLAPTEINYNNVDEIYNKFKNIATDLLDLSNSGKMVSEKYHISLPLVGIEQRSTDFPPITKLRRRLVALSFLLSKLDGRFYPSDYLQKAGMAKDELNQYLNRHEKLNEEKKKFEEFYFEEESNVSKSNELKKEIMNYFSAAKG